MLIPFLTERRRIYERQIGIVATEQPGAPEIECLITGEDGQICIQRVPRLTDQRSFVVPENLDDVRCRGSYSCRVTPPVEDNGEAELAQILAIVLNAGECLV